jgi:hypothetical protein
MWHTERVESAMRDEMKVFFEDVYIACQQQCQAPQGLRTALPALITVLVR